MAKSYRTPYNGFKVSTRILIKRRWVSLKQADAIARQIVAGDSIEALKARLEWNKRIYGS